MNRTDATSGRAEGASPRFRSRTAYSALRPAPDQAALLRVRARLNRCVRGFFEAAGFVEVETPLLAERLIPEPSIGIFATRQHHADGSSRELYLTPSPELWMKRVVAAGMPRVYQVARCFRNVEEQGAFHHREFTMLEWYATDVDYHDALVRMEGLLAALRADMAAADVGGGAALDRMEAAPAEPRGEFVNGSVREPADAAAPPIRRVTMDRLWQDAVGFDPAGASTAELAGLARRLTIPAADTDTWEQIFNRIFLTRVEPRIATHQPVAVFNYPARIPTLAATAGDGVHAQRWELYLAGVEVANCFQEETDRAALGELLASEAQRQRAARVVPQPDLELADVFGGVAACSGVAVGIDRLYALLLGLPAIAPLMAGADSG